MTAWSDPNSDPMRDVADVAERIRNQPTIVLDQPWQIHMYQMLVFKHRAQIELSGMRGSIPLVKAFNKIYGTNFRKKQQIIDKVNIWHNQVLEALRDQPKENRPQGHATEAVPVQGMQAGNPEAGSGHDPLGHKDPD